jgi:hypothetical protein
MTKRPMPKKNIFLILFVSLLAFSLIVVKRNGQSLKVRAGKNQSATVGQSTLLEPAGSEGSNSKPFTIISDEITTTGRVVRVTKDGIERQALIPAGMQIPVEDLEATLFAVPYVPKQPDRPTDVLNGNLVFYGLVIDQDSNVVSGATVDTRIMVKHPGKKTASQDARLLTGSDGRFLIEMPWGQQVQVRVTKTNFTDVPWQMFRYGNIGGIEPRHSPDPNNPVLFSLYSKANAQPLVAFNKVFRLPHDGTPVRIDLTTAGVVSEGGDLIVSADCPEPYNNLKKFPWSLSVNVVGGGLVEAHPIDGRIQNMKQAPCDGYSEGFEVKYDASTPDSEYRRQLDKLYYIGSRNGQIYAKARINMTASWDERGVFFGMTAFVNTKSSRALQDNSE